MIINKPADLTEPQWLLLRHLLQYNDPFYIDFLYEQFSKYQIDRKQFYLMFFSLAGLSYIQLDGHGEQIPGRKQDFRYMVTPKGKRTVAEYTQGVASKNIAQLPPKEQKNGVITAFLPRTIQLRDFILKF